MQYCTHAQNNASSCPASSCPGFSASPAQHACLDSASSSSCIHLWPENIISMRISSICRERTYRRAPDGHRMHITLALTAPTTVRMIRSVHCHTSDRRPDVEPPAAPSFAQLPELPVRIACHTNRRARIGIDFAHFSALQPDSHILDLFLALSAYLVLRDHCRVRARAAAEHCAFPCCRSNIVDLRAERHHAHRQTIPSERCLCRKHARVHDSAHALQQILRNATEKGLHCIPCPHALGCNDVALLLGLHTFD